MSNRQDDALPVVATRINAMEGQEVKPHWMYLTPGQHSWPYLSTFTAEPLVRLSDAQAAIASLQARLDAAEKDAARYRWLCDNNFDRQETQVHTWLHTWEPHSQTGEPIEWKQRIRGGALDRVIDAARGAA